MLGTSESKDLAQISMLLSAPRLTFQPMFEAMLHHYKELLQGGVVCIQTASQAKSRLE